MVRKSKKDKFKSPVEYPSSELLQSSCFEDYMRLIDTYDKFYEKVNIALAFCSAILLLILNSFNYTLFLGKYDAKSQLELFSIFILLLCSSISIICIIWAVIELLLLTRSKAIIVFDSTAIRNDKIYLLPNDQAALWLIDKYTRVISELRDIIHNKQKKYNTVVVLVYNYGHGKLNIL